MKDNLCGERCYANITKSKIDAMIEALKKAGATVTGNNPWDIDIHKHGVKLRATWNEKTSTLCIIVTAKNWYVSCSQIWAEIEKYLPHISSLSDKDIA